MRPFQELWDFERARQHVLARCRPVKDVEKVTLTAALGRVLARDMKARIDVPGFSRAAMDGFAVRAQDTYGAKQSDPVELAILAVCHAGQVPAWRVERGTCVQIATGAPLPEGADAVVQVEHTEPGDGAVSVLQPVYPGQNVSSADSDMGVGQLIVASGSVLTPPRIGALASQGVLEIDVFRKPRVRLFSTGEEIVAPGSELRPGKIYDINRLTLSTLMQMCGAEVDIGGVVKDSLDHVKRALADSLEFDVVVFTGGSSVGERDVLVDALSSLGTVDFHGIAVKPGKPTLFGSAGDALVFGMPGYPTSCLTNGYVLLAPAIRRLGRLPDYERTVQGRLTRNVHSTVGRYQILPVYVDGGEITPVFKESGAITSMSRANGWVEIPANVEVIPEGTQMEVWLF